MHTWLQCSECGEVSEYWIRTDRVVCPCCGSHDLKDEEVTHGIIDAE